MEQSIKDRVLVSLETHKGEFVSGGQIADTLGVSRNAVWKAVQALIAAGYEIESVTGKGYKLRNACSILSAASIQHYLKSERVTVEFQANVDSTNTRLKTRAEEGAPEGLLLAAGEQTAGRGRRGRPFYSPAETGIYFSLLLRPDFKLEDIALITTYAAVCAAEAIEAVMDVKVGIKWVNDLFIGKRKVCGILTEASFDAENGKVSYAVLGIGMNVLAPAEGFPEGLDSVADALSRECSDANDLRARLIAATVDRFMASYGDIPTRPHLEAYRKRSILDGLTVDAEIDGKRARVRVLGIADDFALRVVMPDGTQRELDQGEVHIASSQLATQTLN